MKNRLKKKPNERFFDLAKRRRSIRRYKQDPIDEAALKKILLAGQIAPSGNNSQPWRFIIVDENTVKKQLYDVAGKQPWIIDAPITIAVVADIKSKLGSDHAHSDISIDDPKYTKVLIKSVRDATIAADHMVMAATDEGLGTCWIALFEQEDIKPVLRVPKHCFVVAIITLGYADENPEAGPRKRLSDIASWNHFDMDPYNG